ncbi:uncharacterized protein EV422DRAFT_501622 [Fimicolochytrium jonesii]|uniref:uncharacterized protein n=1 Tax=Fimicolochytrium jonesii TaxID=1396493 RepID=UPI0022FE5B57|nr:uncharacterized protein EV422DRAFT_501622 [Fimicolochytrium jonesii]KAI8816157.1 hypothetical protein EV422DRAFT_501622 [Fimicolochytrium jonesii]
MLSTQGHWLPTLDAQIQYAQSNQHLIPRPPPSTTTSQNNRTNQNVECSLHGHLRDTALQKLFERLVAVTGDIAFEGRENFWEHEIGWRPAVETPFGAGRNDDVPVFLRSEILGPQKEFLTLHKRQWVLCFRGAPEPPKPGDGKRATQRVIYESRLKGDALKYMEMVGYTFNFEFTRRGYVFWYRSIRILIYRVYKLETRNKVTSAVPIDDTNDGWTVEAIAPLTTAERVPEKVHELHAFAGLIAG